jgi:hypothetical protein
VTFEAWLQHFRVGASGDAVLTLGIPQESKWQAAKVTDLAGRSLVVTVRVL